MSRPQQLRKGKGEARGEPLPCSSGDFKKRKGGETGFVSGDVPKTESSSRRIKATERIRTSRCMQEPGRGRRRPIIGRGGLPSVLQRERGTQERQRSRKQGVLGERIAPRGDESPRSDRNTLGAQEEAGDSGWDVGARSEKSWGRRRVGGCGAAAPHLS